MDDARDRLTRCFTAVFPALDATEIVRARPEAVAEWDSVAHVTLLAVVEEEFGITLGPEDIEHLTSFEALLGYVAPRTARVA